MANKVIPTKANLLAAKSSLEFAQKGYDLLDKKRRVLIQEMMNLNREAASLQKKIEESFQNSYAALMEATITMGSELLDDIARSMTTEPDYEIIYRSVMGVEIPQIKGKEEHLKADYSFHETTTAFDTAVIDLREIRSLVYQLAQVETGVFRLATEIKKTQKRANALDKIQIPKYQSIVTEIDNILAEKEREDFFRLKKVKNKKNRQKEKGRKI